MDRRRFLERCGLLGAAAWYPELFAGALAAQPTVGLGDVLEADVVIIGGGLGGCAAAISASRSGLRVILTEETDWIGGQLTAQAVPPDEHRWIERFGSTALYRQLRRRIRDYYRQNYPLTFEATQDEALNPGNGLVSPLCHEPRVALAALGAMLAPYLSSGRLTLLLHHGPVEATVDGDRVRAIRVRDLRDESETILLGRHYIDATEQGDLLPLTGAEFVVGAESREETGEPHAAVDAQPSNVQAFTVCFAADYLPDEDHTIDEPEGYAFWREFIPQLEPPWPGRLLELETTHPVTLEPRLMQFDPEAQRSRGGEAMNLWFYRRIADRMNFVPGAYPADITLVNWPQNDYLLGNLIDGSEDERREHLARAKQLSLSLLYWLQTEAPRRGGRSGWRGLRLRRDVVGTEDGLAKQAYVRESRRIRAEFTVLEQHVSAQALREAASARGGPPMAEPFEDSVGVGSYRLDLHPSTGGNNYIDIETLPFQIPLGALIPGRIENLTPGCKNIGVTHLTTGCYRLHPIEWNVGEAAGALAAFSLLRGEPPRRVRNYGPLLGDFQALLVKGGVELAWPRGVLSG